MVRVGIYFFENAEIIEGLGFILLKSIKQGTSDDLFHKSKERNGCGFFSLKLLIKGTMGFVLLITKNKMRLGIFYIKQAKIKYGWDLFHLKC